MNRYKVNSTNVYDYRYSTTVFISLWQDFKQLFFILTLNVLVSFLIEVTTYETVVRIGGAGILLHLIMYIYTYMKQILKFLSLYYR